METKIKCPYCGGNIDGGDAYCRMCGKEQGRSLPFRYTHAGMVVLTLLFGPAALPCIWKSPKLNKKTRAGYLVMNLLVTGLMVSALVGIYGNVNRQVQETLKVLEQTGLVPENR